MKKTLLFLILASSLSACNTTGDPMQGGLFFNYDAAQERLRAKQAYLGDLEREQQSLRGAR